MLGWMMSCIAPMLFGGAVVEGGGRRQMLSEIRADGKTVLDVVETANRSMETRSETLSAIASVELQLNEAARRLSLAKQSAVKEEFQAAQEGRLAVASEATLAEIAAVELEQKTFALRKQGLQIKKEDCEAAIVAALAEADRIMGAFVAERMNALQRRFEEIGAELGRMVRECLTYNKLFAKECKTAGFNSFYQLGGDISTIQLFGPKLGSKVFNPVLAPNKYFESEEAKPIRELAEALQQAIAPLAAVAREVAPTNRG